ncbi:MAG TPA: hypothetical protein VGN07_23820, partial [Steroidobacteraceae bacterium]
MPVAAGGAVATFLGFAEGTTAFAVVAGMAAAVDRDPDLVGLTRAKLETGGDLDVWADVRAAGEVRVEFYADIAEGTRLVGPLVVTGHCMEGLGFTPGTVVFCDPALPVRSGDTVLVTNFVGGKGPMGLVRSSSMKIFEHLAGSWWLRTTDGGGVAMHSTIQIVGRVVASIHLPKSSETVRLACAETERIYAALPPDKPLPDGASREIGKDKTIYPSRPIIGPLFWR